MDFHIATLNVYQRVIPLYRIYMYIPLESPLYPILPWDYHYNPSLPGRVSPRGGSQAPRCGRGSSAQQRCHAPHGRRLGERRGAMHGAGRGVLRASRVAETWRSTVKGMVVG